MNMNMTEKETLQLIELYKGYPLLWKASDTEFYNKSLKAEAWNDIATITGYYEEVCKRKIESLRSSYRREKLKEKKHAEVKGADSTFQSSWFAYKALSFLDEKDSLQKPINSAPNSPATPSAQTNNTTNSSSNKNSDMDDKFCETIQLFPAPKSPKRPRVERIERIEDADIEELLADSLELIETDSNRMSSVQTMNQNNQLIVNNGQETSFSNYIVSKMQQYPPEKRKTVEYAIIDILARADQGFFGNLPSAHRLLTLEYSHDRSEQNIDDHRKMFLISLLPEVKKLTDQQMREFQIKILLSLDEILTRMQSNHINQVHHIPMDYNNISSVSFSEATSSSDIITDTILLNTTDMEHSLTNVQ